MAKLALFALAFMAIAFCVASAIRTTIVTTSITNRGVVYDGLDNGRGYIDGLYFEWPSWLPYPPDWPFKWPPLKFDGLYNKWPSPRWIDGLDNPTSSQQCDSQIPMEQVNHCTMHLTQGISFDRMAVRPFQHHQEQHLQQCCSQLKQVSEQCQCAAIQQAFNKAWQQEGLQKVSQIASKAYKLPNDCGLEVQDCPLNVPRI